MTDNNTDLTAALFFGKRPPKITEGSPFDPHWPISRINPAVLWVRLRPTRTR